MVAETVIQICAPYYQETPAIWKIQRAFSQLEVYRYDLVEGGRGDMYGGGRIVPIDMVLPHLCAVHGSLKPKVVEIENLPEWRRCDMVNAYSTKHPDLEDFQIKECDEDFQLEDRARDAIAFLGNLGDLVPQVQGDSIAGPSGLEAQAQVPLLNEPDLKRAQAAIELLIRVWSTGVLKEKIDGGYVRLVVLKAIDQDPRLHHYRNGVA